MIWFLLAVIAAGAIFIARELRHAPLLDDPAPDPAAKLAGDPAQPDPPVAVIPATDMTPVAVPPPDLEGGAWDRLVDRLDDVDGGIGSGWDGPSLWESHRRCTELLAELSRCPRIADVVKTEDMLLEELLRVEVALGEGTRVIPTHDAHLEHVDGAA